MNTKVIRRELDKNNKLTWPLFVVKIICELLDHGTPPSAVSKNLHSIVSLLCPEVEIEELPNVDYVRKCRRINTIIEESAAAYVLAKNKK